MDWGRIQANWQHFKVSAQARWERITAEELEVIGGRRELLTGHIGDIYGITLAAAQAEVESWRGEQREPRAAPA